MGLTSRDAKSKAAASEATNIFQSHYPELLVCFLNFVLGPEVKLCSIVQEIFRQRTNSHELDLLDLQASFTLGHFSQNVSRGDWTPCAWKGAVANHRRQGIAETLRW